MALERLCVHTMTNKPWSLEEAIDAYQRRGIGGISVWQNVVEKMKATEAGKLLEASDLTVVSYVRGGFFPADNNADREKAIEHNKRMIAEAAAIGAPLLVLVCGAEPTANRQRNEEMILAGIEQILPTAEEFEVILGIEPLHPMYADTRSAISDLGQANRIAAAFGSDLVKVVFDVYHLWWDSELHDQLRDTFAKDIFGAYHICDWMVPTKDMLNDRGLMGEGCIPLREIDEQIAELGFQGFREVEIFSARHWKTDQYQYLDQIVESYQEIYKV